MASKRRYAANNAANNIVGNNPQLQVRITKENKDKAGITTTPPNSSFKKRKGKQRQKAGASSTSFAIGRASHSQSHIHNLQLLVRRLSRENPAGISQAGPESPPCMKLGGKTYLTSKKTGGVTRGGGA
jgi:hypothetical protein